MGSQIWGQDHERESFHKRAEERSQIKGLLEGHIKMPSTDNGPSRDVSPAKTPKVEKKDQESFNTATNAPNNPKKDKQPTSFNTTDDYE
jgi:hypothetical protein